VITAVISTIDMIGWIMVGYWMNKERTVAKRKEHAMTMQKIKLSHYFLLTFSMANVVM